MELTGATLEQTGLSVNETGKIERDLILKLHFRHVVSMPIESINIQVGFLDAGLPLNP